MLVADVTGDLPEIIGNEKHLYEGDLSLYFRILFFEPCNMNNPYHNFRHTLHVVWLCHKACQYTTRSNSRRAKCATCGPPVQHWVGATAVPTGICAGENQGSQAAAAATPVRAVI